MKHRYILCGAVWESPQIKNYRLVSSLKYSGCQAIRVAIPDNIKLFKYDGDSYSTTDCDKTIHELGCDCYIVFNGKWRKFNWLKNIEPCWWFRALEYIFGLHNCYDTLGWTDDFDRYKGWLSNGEMVDEDKQKYPPFREDKKGLKLKVKLEDNEELLNFFKNGSGENDWLKFYDAFDRQLKENPDKEIWCE